MMKILLYIVKLGKSKKTKNKTNKTLTYIVGNWFVYTNILHRLYMNKSHTLMYPYISVIDYKTVKSVSVFVN